MIDGLSRKYLKIKILHRHKKLGLGSAYIEGFRYVLKQQPPYERIIQMDADFSHFPKHLNDLLNATQDKDIGLGSRYIPKGQILNWQFVRRILSYIANLYVRFWLGFEIKDWTSGFRCFRRTVLADIDFESVRARGYLFQIEVLYRCLCVGSKFTEVPITFIERKKGKSKMGFYEIWEAFWGGVFWIRFLEL